MEEPEIAIPPHTQKRIILNVISNSSQAIFTSHSPYILEEFNAQNVMVVSKTAGEMNVKPAGTPPNVKPKEYRESLRKRFCESLLAKRVLITEGRTEYDVYSAVARKLEEFDSSKYMSFERMAISLVNAETDSQVGVLGRYYKELGKTVFAVFDKQSDATREEILASTHFAYEAEEHGIENVVLKLSKSEALRRYALFLAESVEWPQHLAEYKPDTQMNNLEISESLFKYFKWSKGSGTLADFLVQCNEDEIPEFFKSTISSIVSIINPKSGESDDNEQIPN